jgi:hypothetical protein
MASWLIQETLGKQTGSGFHLLHLLVSWPWSFQGPEVSILIIITGITNFIWQFWKVNALMHQLFLFLSNNHMLWGDIRKNTGPEGLTLWFPTFLSFCTGYLFTTDKSFSQKNSSSHELSLEMVQEYGEGRDHYEIELIIEKLFFEHPLYHIMFLSNKL